MQQNVYIVAAKRTAIGSFGGSLKKMSATDLAIPVIRDLMKECNLPNDKIDEVILGNVFKAGVKGNPARQAAIKAGIDASVPAMTIDKQCASGLRSITIGYQEILTGLSDIVVAGGTESMSNVPHLVLNGRWGQKLGDMKTVDALLHDGLHCAIEGYHMGVTAENLVEKYNISRQEQDEFAFNSQQKALQAIQTKRFQDEIIQLELKTKKGVFQFDHDEHPRDTTIEQLNKLPSVFKENGSVTAGNASGLNDGAAVVVLASEKAVREHNLKPLAKIRSAASAAVPPSIMGIGPVPATKRALDLARLSVYDIDLFEFNEAFAAQVIAVNRELNIDPNKINVNGGAVALGHPVGCSGARIVVTLLHELQKQKQSLGLASLCVGGGQGVTLIVETV